ncbi:MAG: sulfite exporter TauE/SafE family protein [Rhodomicrobium sp.]|nr:sulfite exporter TauE/SafE family protein [Rhodomicrobium sp.]
MELHDWVAVAVVVLAGFVRGVTGFGGAMVMAPPLSLLLGPVQAVVVTLMLETFAAIPLFPKALPQVNWRILAYLTIPAGFTVPLGGYLLMTLDPAIGRKLISLVVVVFSVLLLSGIRYSGTPRSSTSVALGTIVGVLLGSTSVGAPPVILYLMSSSDPHRVTRANLTVFVTAISVIGLVMLFAAGAVTRAFAAYAALLAAPYIVATWIGGQVFETLSEAASRRFALIFMFAMGLYGLFA